MNFLDELNRIDERLAELNCRELRDDRRDVVGEVVRRAMQLQPKNSEHFGERNE